MKAEVSGVWCDLPWYVKGVTVTREGERTKVDFRLTPMMFISAAAGELFRQNKSLYRSYYHKSLSRLLKKMGRYRSPKRVLTYR